MFSGSRRQSLFRKFGRYTNFGAADNRREDVSDRQLRERFIAQSNARNKGVSNDPVAVKLGMSSSVRRTRSSGGGFRKRARSAYTRTKSRSSSKRGTRRSKSFGGRFRRFRRRYVKKNMARPRWFIPLVKGTRPDLWAYEHGGRIEIESTGFQCWTTFWKQLSMIDIQRGLDETITTFMGNTSSIPTRLGQKGYISGLERKHIWRNSINNDVTVKFYTLTPRRDIPYATSKSTDGTISIVQKIAPPATADYKTGGLLEDPPMFEDAANNMLAEFSASVNNISPRQLSYTPYMNAVATRAFKISRLKVNGPNGKSFVQKLLPGQTCNYTGSHQKPYGTSWNKFAMNYNAAQGPLNVINMYQALKETPIILMSLEGGVAHDSTDKTLVDTATAFIDYKQITRMEFFHINSEVTKANDWTTNEVTLAAPEAVQVVDADDQKVAQ